MMQIRRILALDPSSTVCGFAIGNTRGEIEQAGLLKPSGKHQAIERAEEIAREVVDLIELWGIDAVVVETPAPAAAPRKGQNQRGQATYGMAVGIIWATIRWHWSTPIESVPADLWTRHRSKARRIEEIAARITSYDKASDPGGDCADAIGLLEWWAEKERMRPDAAIRN